MGRRFVIDGRRAFTLVELLVVIGIIAVLVAILLPVLAGARKQSERTKCLAALQQLGHGFMLYAANNQGAWPMQRLLWSSGGTRERRWYDFLSPYVASREINPDGNNANDIASADIKDGNQILWGCPTWRRYLPTGPISIHTGYNMNTFPFAPDDLDASGNYYVNQTKVAERNLANLPDPAALVGKFFKQTAWTKPADRCLMFDSIHPLTVVNYNKLRPDFCSAWPYVPNTTTPFPVQPDVLLFPIDFNRHGKKDVGNPADQPTVNILFCDGHAGFVSAREAFRAIRFK
jgi:prepilin-type N-terminal cleavage/methylation domain-containing protein/prepilin-type processing-associated H-X9-DG protein